MVEEFPVSLVPSDRMILLEIFDQTFLIENPSKEKWLSEADDGQKFYTDGSLFFRRNLITKNPSLFKPSPLFFILNLEPFWFLLQFDKNAREVKQSAFAWTVELLY
jgi:hypothetical protein